MLLNRSCKILDSFRISDKFCDELLLKYVQSVKIQGVIILEYIIIFLKIPGDLEEVVFTAINVQRSKYL